MDSDPGAFGGLALLAAGAAFFLGAAIVLSIRRIARRSQQEGRPGLSAIFLSLSAAVACASWTIVLSGRGISGWEELYWYLVGGGAAGAVVGAFPRAAGVSLALISALVWIAAAAEVSGWSAWVEGGEVARLGAYSVEPDVTLCGLSLPDRKSLPIGQNLRLPPGDLGLAVQILDFRGPLAFLVGPRYYRLHAVLAGDGGQTLPVETGPLVRADGSIPRMVGLLGISTVSATSERFPAEEFASASLRIQADGSLLLIRE